MAQKNLGSLSRLFDPEIVHVLKTSLPLVVVELISSLYSLIDTYFVKNLGENAVAALGISGYILWLISSFFALFHTPLSIIMAQCIGGKEFDKARSTLGYITLLGGSFAVMLTVFLTYFTPLIVVIQSGATGLTFTYAVEYLRIRFCALLVTFIAMTFDIAIVSTGRTLYSMISNTVGLTINSVLDPLLIYGLYWFPKLEVAGAAYATVISQFLSMLISAIFLAKLGLKPSIRSKLPHVKQVLSLGFFAFTERILFSFGNNVYAGIISRLGDIAMAAHSIGLRIESLVYMPGIAFLTTASILVGQKVGALKFDDAKRIGLKTIRLGSLVMTFIGIVIATTSYNIVQPFTLNEEVRKLASLYLIIAGLSELGLGLAMTSGGAIRGAGNVVIPFVINLSCLFLIRITISFFLTSTLGVVGPWIAMFIDVYVRGILLYYFFKMRFFKIVKKVV